MLQSRVVAGDGRVEKDDLDLQMNELQGRFEQDMEIVSRNALQSQVFQFLENRNRDATQRRRCVFVNADEPGQRWEPAGRRDACTKKVVEVDGEEAQGTQPGEIEFERLFDIAGAYVQEPIAVGHPQGKDEQQSSHTVGIATHVAIASDMVWIDMEGRVAGLLNPMSDPFVDLDRIIRTPRELAREDESAP